MKAAIYLRISQDPSGLAAGVRRQQTECEELAAQRGIDVVATFRDNNVPATKRAKRLGWQALLDGLAAGEFDSVIAWANDRLYRSTEVRLEIMRAVQATGGRIITVKDGEIDPTSASGRMTMGVLGEIASFERERASERQVARWKQRKQDGKLVTLGRRPFGLERRGEQMVEVKAEADAIRHAARELIRGRSLYAVTKELPPTPYGNSWRPQHVRRMMMSGHLADYGVLDAETQRLVVARLKPQKKGPGRPRRMYALSGLVVCGLCGSKMAASSGSFHCQDSRCGRLGIKADRLNQYVLSQIYEHLPPEWDEQPADVDVRTPEEAAVLRELGEIEDRIAALADNLDLSEQVLARRTAALEARRDELTAALGKPAQGPGIDFAAILSGDLDRMVGDDREWLRQLIERVTITKAANGRWTPVEDRVEITWVQREQV